MLFQFFIIMNSIVGDSIEHKSLTASLIISLGYISRCVIARSKSMNVLKLLIHIDK